MNKLLKVTGASLVGTTLEFYDHFIYGTAAVLIFPHIFFKGLSPDTALTLSLLTYGLAFISRPLGAIIFGHFGDKLGRKKILVVVLIIMGVSTFLIGLLPNYATAGSFSAYALCFLRLMQGIALGGEWGGAALMVDEYAKNNKYRSLLGSMVQLASPLGFLIASLVFVIVNHFFNNLYDIAWRIPFLLSFILVIVGIYVRSNIDESPEFKTPNNKNIPIAIVFSKHLKAIILTIGTRVGSDIAFYVFALFPLFYLPQIGVEKEVALNVSIAAAIGQAIGVPIFGYYCDKLGTKKILFYGAILNIIYVFIFFSLLDSKNNLLIITAGFLGLFCLSSLWAPLASHLPKMFPVEVRYSGTGLGFQAAGILGGAIAPTICFSLYRYFNSSFAVSIYLSITLVIALICTILTKE